MEDNTPANIPNTAAVLTVGKPHCPANTNIAMNKDNCEERLIVYKLHMNFQILIKRYLYMYLEKCSNMAVWHILASRTFSLITLLN